MHGPMGGARLAQVVLGVAARHLDELPQTVLSERFGKPFRQPVVHDASLLASCDQACGAQNSESIGDSVFTDGQREREVTDAELFDDVEGVEQARPRRVCDERQHAGEPVTLLRGGQPLAGLGDAGAVNGVSVL